MSVSINSRRRIEVDDVPGPDFTTYTKDEPAVEIDPLQVAEAVFGGGAESDPRAPAKDPEAKTYSYDGSFAIIRNVSPPVDSETGRGLACRAYAERYWSITLRCASDNQRLALNDYEEVYQKELREGLARYAKNHRSPNCKAKDYLGYCPKGYEAYSEVVAQPAVVDAATKPGTAGEVFLNDIYPVCKQLYDVLDLDPFKLPFGLITITGATDSSKSLITRGLIFLFLEAAAKQAIAKGVRRPHLVTFEDPIEEYFVKDPVTDSPPDELEELTDLLFALKLDYTPRQRGVDADSLTRVIRDAKRQTPAVLFVGETRDPQDWKQLLDFGSSGHLVFTTSHSGSVVEALSQILRNTKTQTPSQRSEVARAIRGIVNIRSLTHAVKDQNGKAGGLRALLPAVWKSTPRSINNLVADGLSSILPALGRESNFGYYGRTYFAKALTDQDSPTTKKFNELKNRPVLQEEIVRQAMEWDIQGM
jgi:Type II/IV secretion system protein